MFIKVKVTSGARKENIEKISDDRFLVSVREKAERNEANERVCGLLASYFDISISKIRIINGHKKPSKLIEVKNN